MSLEYENMALANEVPEITFDLHHHVGRLVGFGSGGESAASVEDDAAARIRHMDRHGIRQCLLMPGTYPASGSSDGIAPINDAVARYRELYPDRFAAFLGTVDPRDVDTALAEIDRCVGELSVNGFVWHHHFFGTFANDPAMLPLIERVQSYGLPAFIHIIAGSFLESPWRLETLADEFPETTFVALDGFSSPDYAQWMSYLAEKHQNVLFDTGMATSVGHMIPEFVNRVGAERLLYGSDFYSAPKLFEVPFGLYELLNAGLAKEDLEKILGANARKLLKLDIPSGANR